MGMWQFTSILAIIAAIGGWCWNEFDHDTIMQMILSWWTASLPYRSLIFRGITNAGYFLWYGKPPSVNDVVYLSYTYIVFSILLSLMFLYIVAVCGALVIGKFWASSLYLMGQTSLSKWMYAFGDRFIVEQQLVTEHRTITDTGNEKIIIRHSTRPRRSFLLCSALFFYIVTCIALSYLFMSVPAHIHGYANRIRNTPCHPMVIASDGMAGEVRSFGRVIDEAIFGVEYNNALKACSKEHIDSALWVHSPADILFPTTRPVKEMPLFNFRELPFLWLTEATRTLATLMEPTVDILEANGRIFQTMLMPENHHFAVDGVIIMLDNAFRQHPNMSNIEFIWRLSDVFHNWSRIYWRTVGTFYFLMRRYRVLSRIMVLVWILSFISLTIQFLPPSLAESLTTVTSQVFDACWPFVKMVIQ